MVTVGIAALRNRLTAVLRRVAKGERVVVTKRGRPMAIISKVPQMTGDATIDTLLFDGVARWAGGKPSGSARPVKLKKGTLNFRDRYRG